MVEPRIIPREAHTVSRRDIDPDALKVLYRLRQFDHVAYLVGGSVRDLLLGRRPKDFDIGTSAHPQQVKRLFRNCWIIGRRFRLAHVKFGNKVIEVATFRRQLAPGEEIVAEGVPAPDPTTPEGQHLIHHDNTFGTPEEDAFRRDFTINALAYDISTFSVIDYIGGLDDLRAGIVRSIGDPGVRLREDPVRMLRAIALAARLDFTIEPTLLAAIRTHRLEIAKSSLARLLEEYYKILRAGSSEKAFRQLADVGLLEPISSELHLGANDPLWRSLAALDRYRKRFESTPETLTNAILMGTLLVPLGISLHPQRPASFTADEQLGNRWSGAGGEMVNSSSTAGEQTGSAADRRAKPRRPPIPRLGDLPLARRDVERLRLIMSLQRRIKDLGASPRAQRALAHRHIFREALTWMEIHGGVPDLVEHWKALLADMPPPEAEPTTADNIGNVDPAHIPSGRRRRRRRRGRRGGGRPPTA
jgi:tRNA nucleotidyltransferase/poly(A) polymerase